MTRKGRGVGCPLLNRYFYPTAHVMTRLVSELKPISLGIIISGDSVYILGLFSTPGRYPSSRFRE